MADLRSGFLQRRVINIKAGEIIAVTSTPMARERI